MNPTPPPKSKLVREVARIGNQARRLFIAPVAQRLGPVSAPLLKLLGKVQREIGRVQRRRLKRENSKLQSQVVVPLSPRAKQIQSDLIEAMHKRSTVRKAA